MLLFINSENTDWKLVPRVIVLIWYFITLTVFLSETYSGILSKLKFGEFKQGGSFLFKDYIVNLFLIFICTICLYYLAASRLLV